VLEESAGRNVVIWEGEVGIVHTVTLDMRKPGMVKGLENILKRKMD